MRGDAASRAVQLTARSLAAALFVAVVATVATEAVRGEPVVNQDGDVIVTLDGGITPTVLPRHELRPVAVRVAGSIRTVSGDLEALPQVKRMSVAINRQGRLFDRGLPTCRVAAIEPATVAVARRTCGDSIVGSGSVVVQVRIPGQTPFSIKARLLVFNGPHRNGHKLILAQAISRRPPDSFVLVFRVDEGPGELGTVLTTTLSPQARRWAYLQHFDITLRKTYEFGGRRRSFVSAACPAPEGFTIAPFSFARAIYSFSDGRSLGVALPGECRVGTSVREGS